MKEHRKYRRIAAVSVFVVVVACGLFLWLRPKTTTISTIAIVRRTMENHVIATGTVKSTTRQIVSTTDLPSPIQSTNVQVGDKVSVGDALVTCANASQTAALQAADEQVSVAQKSLRDAEAQYSSAPPGFQAQLGSSVDAARASLTQAEAQRAEAQAALGATVVRSTISGRVIMVNPQGIAPDGSQAPLVEVVGYSKQIVSYVSEEDAVQLRAGMPVKVTSDAFGSTHWVGHILRVASYAMSNSAGAGQVEVDLSVPGNFSVPLGYQVDVQILSATHRMVPVIPYDALVPDGNQYAAYVVQGGKVHKVDVALGITGDTVVEVTKGLQVGERVVVSPPSDLQNGQAVNVS